ncbi:hypothetical protein [Achromobacter mucicolens]|uniref:hypothetical protein n=1 Tax=Achromobacter mucicolens TaxID=1389922 RepID=UPI0007C6DC7C|nr:hypothetical protein [Achromobacter mucicolens]OAE56727.1 hypothetical protein A7J67_08805 [Achromobacter xylosoxidans]
MKIDIFEPAGFCTLHLNRNVKQLDNLKVCQAVAAAIAVDEIVRYAGKDVADKGCSVADGAISQARGEPDAQKQLALWKDPFAMSFRLSLRRLL